MTQKGGTWLAVDNNIRKRRFSIEHLNLFFKGQCNPGFDSCKAEMKEEMHVQDVHLTSFLKNGG